MGDATAKRAPGRGRFISFEGGEGSGKSTQINKLAERLEAAKLRAIVTREPGGSPGAEVIRHVLLSGMGKLLESRIAPPLYHFTPIVTLSESSKRELVDDLHFSAKRVTVVPPGIDPRFSPGGSRAPSTSGTSTAASSRSPRAWGWTRARSSASTATPT